uniref:WAP domain-containing protein n=1 Tax=Cyprinus carpio TaxID=7962 RepID=A0A8C1PCR0_CYPCA
MNARVCCSLIAVLLCLSVSKPGVCPDDKDMIGMCVEDCFGDSECPDDEKCCSNGCGHKCTPPYDGIYIILMCGSLFVCFAFFAI